MRRYPDRSYFERIGRDAGFGPAPLETVFRLIDLLEVISQELDDELLLRGGTALNLLHLDIPRLSVDLDLDYVATADAEQARRRRPAIVQHVIEIGRRAGYHVAEERPSYAMAHVRMGYSDTAGRPSFIKLDLNFLDRVPILSPTRIEVRHPFGDDISAFEVQTAALNELVAAKLVALVRRRLPRDLFDVAAVSEVDSLDLDVVRAVLVVRGSAYPPPSPDDYDVDVLDEVRQSRWRAEVLPLIRKPSDLDVREAKIRARRLLEPAITLGPEHLGFLEALGQGRIRPDVLPLPESRDRIAANPGLHWRLGAGAHGLEER